MDAIEISGFNHYLFNQLFLDLSRNAENCIDLLRWGFFWRGGGGGEGSVDESF